MHELSVVMNIVQIATDKAREADASVIDEIELDIGTLSSVDMQAFDFAWQQAVKKTMLEKTLATINRIGGEGHCLACDSVFTVNRLYDNCPHCGEYTVEITRGRELRVKSMVIH